jgi:hypothetical protein
MHMIYMAQIATSLMLLSQVVGATQEVESGTARPVFKLDVPDPTADKPQSKLWYSQGSWWACLPTQDGNQLWKRSPTGWAQASGVDSPLRGLFGHGDVYAEQDRIYVVLVSPQALTIAALCYDSLRCDYVQAAPPTTWPSPADESIETATITTDQTGRLWVAYNADQSVWVRASRDRTGICWTEPILLAHGTGDDDICSIARLCGGVGVIWSNQNDETISFRFHRNGCPPDTWHQKEIVAQGDKTADDHLNCAVAEDGTLYVATKTSLDTLNRPLLSLRERLPEGRWRSHAYATLTSNGEPSRPIAIMSHSSKRLVLCHTLYGRQNAGVNSIIGLICRYPDPDLHCKGVEIIQPTAGLNNVTGCKSSLPINVPSVVLASDGDGNVYEAIVDLTH